MQTAHSAIYLPQSAYTQARNESSFRFGVFVVLGGASGRFKRTYTDNVDVASLVYMLKQSWSDRCRRVGRGGDGAFEFIPGATVESCSCNMARLVVSPCVVRTYFFFFFFFSKNWCFGVFVICVSVWSFLCSVRSKWFPGGLDRFRLVSLEEDWFIYLMHAWFTERIVMFSSWVWRFDLTGAYQTKSLW